MRISWQENNFRDQARKAVAVQKGPYEISWTWKKEPRLKIEARRKSGWTVSLGEGIIIIRIMATRDCK
jgi:hypothetical protein